MNLGLRIALGAEGLSEEEINAVDNAILAAERIAAAFQQIAPLVQKEWPDIILVLPVVQRLLKLAKG